MSLARAVERARRSRVPGGRESGPRVSIVMPVWNAGPYLRVAIESLVAQTFRDFELLVYDDGSADGSADVVAAYAALDPRIRLFRMEHAGYTTWLNRGLHDARAPYVARMDADDIARPRRLGAQVAWLDTHPDCSAVGAEVRWIDPDGRPIAPANVPFSHDAIDAELMKGRGGVLPHPAVTYRRDAVLAVGGYRPAFEPAEDLDLFLRLAEHGRLANLPEVLLDYRLHLKKVSAERAGEQRRHINQILREARSRRGLPEDDAAPLADIGEQMPSVDYWCFWARSAIEAGHRATACRYAWAVLRAEPARSRSWRLLIRALLGVGALPHRRALRRLRTWWETERAA